MIPNTYQITIQTEEEDIRYVVDEVITKEFVKNAGRDVIGHILPILIDRIEVKKRDFAMQREEEEVTE